MQHKKEHFIQICKSSSTMLSASKALDISYTTFIRYAKKFGCYKPNKSGKGTNKPRAYIIPLTEILEGLHPTFQTFKLKTRLIKEGVFKNECHVCGLTE